MQYQAKSIIYFEGDVSEKVYILQSGKICLNYIDIETGQEIREMAKTGEFFGVKSALGKYPREETVDVLANSNVLVFSVTEFETLFQNNIRISMQMLKVFSNQLRRIHRNVRNLLAFEDQTDPEKGLFNIGEYYYNNKKYKQALYAFRRYLTYYPTGFFQSQATQYIGKN
jgi:CRP-like cAMP-binding protein